MKDLTWKFFWEQKKEELIKFIKWISLIIGAILIVWLLLLFIKFIFFIIFPNVCTLENAEKFNGGVNTCKWLISFTTFAFLGGIFAGITQWLINNWTKAKNRAKMSLLRKAQFEYNAKGRKNVK